MMQLHSAFCGRWELAHVFQSLKDGRHGTFLLSSPDPSCAQTRSSRSRRSITRQPCSKLKHLDSTWAKSLETIHLNSDVWLCNDSQPCHPMILCNLCVLDTLPCYIMSHWTHHVVCMWGTHSLSFLVFNRKDQNNKATSKKWCRTVYLVEHPAESQAVKRPKSHPAIQEDWYWRCCRFI